MPSTIFDYIKKEEAAFELPINILGWSWSMKEHIKKGFYYRHGRLLTGNDPEIPVKNIVRRLLMLRYWSEDVEVKDITLYTDDPDDEHLSFLIKAYHDNVFVQKNNMDSFIDEWKESKINYGLGIAKQVEGVRPDVVNLESIAFADQTNVLKGPIGFKYYYSPSELKKMRTRGWENVDELISLAQTQKQLDPKTGVPIQTPGKAIEVYEVYGDLPDSYMDENDDSGEYSHQMWVIGFYKNDRKEDKGIVLFNKKIKPGNLKVAMGDPVYSRACGYGGVEELEEDQAWTNFAVQVKKDFLEGASKTLLTTDDPTLTAKHPAGLKNLQNMELIERSANTTLTKLDNNPTNYAVFDRFEQELMEHAQNESFATDPLLGEPSKSGTPFRAQERQVFEGGKGHKYRMGKYAKDLESVYKDWIIPEIQKDIVGGTTFLAELSFKDMKYVVDTMVRNEVNKFKAEKLFSGEIYNDADVELFETEAREKLSKSNKKMFQIVKNEFKNKKINVKVNIAGKQSDLGLMTDKITNLWRLILQNPQGFLQVLQMPGMSDSFLQLLQYSDVSPAEFSQLIYSKGNAAPSPIQTDQLQQQLTNKQPQNELSQ